MLIIPSAWDSDIEITETKECSCQYIKKEIFIHFKDGCSLHTIISKLLLEFDIRNFSS